MRLGWVLLITLVGGCSSSSDEPSLGKALFERLRPATGAEAAKPAAKGAPKRITRAQIEKFNLAMLRANLQGEQVAPLMIARTANRGYVTYLSQAGQSVTLRSALVTSTRGLGTDLLSVEHNAGDPLTKPTKVANWPATTTRTYYVPGPGLKGTAIVVNCSVTRVKDHDIEIAETPFQTTQMTEACRTDQGQSFANHHFVDRSTGQVWVTQQWVGPDMAPLGLEVLEPVS